MKQVIFQKILFLVGLTLPIFFALPSKVSFTQIPTSTEFIITPNISRAEQQIKRGEYREAIKEFNQALQINPNDATTYFNRGSLYILIRDYKKANEDLQLAANLFFKEGKTMLHQQALRQMKLIRSLQKL